MSKHHLHLPRVGVAFVDVFNTGQPGKPLWAQASKCVARVHTGRTVVARMRSTTFVLGWQRQKLSIYFTFGTLDQTIGREICTTIQNKCHPRPLFEHISMIMKMHSF